MLGGLLHHKLHKSSKVNPKKDSTTSTSNVINNVTNNVTAHNRYIIAPSQSVRTMRYSQVHPMPQQNSTRENTNTEYGCFMC